MNEIISDIAALKRKVEQKPNSREKSLLMTKLDEARHWANDMEKNSIND